MTSPLNVLLIGSGGREHAIAWSLARSALLAKLWVAPGNAGTADLGENVPEIKATDIEGIAALAKRVRADLVIVGPDDPLALGLVDRLTVEGIRCFGPTRDAAELEWSKSFAKDVMQRAGIATAEARAFDSLADANTYLRQLEDAGAAAPVVKANGLALGKGVVVAADFEEARAALVASMVGRSFGDAGARVLIEERMAGPETSAHAFTDGITVRHMPFSCDHKAVFDGNLGPNTGGMGVFSPPGWLSEADARAIERDVTERTVRAMFEAGRPYRGVLYPGMMLTSSGPRVVEFNCRFGDPEAQALLPRLEGDLLEICWAVANNTLHEVDVRWSERATVCVVMASGGYPGAYSTGARIEGLGDIDADVQVFFAGVARDAEGELVTAGGRVLSVTASGTTIAEAQARAYDNVRRVHFEGAHYRTDIGDRGVTAELAATRR